MLSVRESLTAAAVIALREREDVLALWESGSIAFGRVDEYSDIDLCAVVTTGRVGAVAEALRQRLEQAAPITQEFRRRTGPADMQFFWQFEGLSPFLFIDIDISEQTPDPITVDPSSHGAVIVHFDRGSHIVLAEENPEERSRRVRERLDELAAMSGLSPVFVLKHIRRGDVLAAVGDYVRLMMMPLIELLRLKHCPERTSFKTTYARYDLPPDVVSRLEGLALPCDLNALECNVLVAAKWMGELLQSR